MATTSPDEIWTPDGGDQYALTTDLAIYAGTVQDAINRRAPRNGTTTQRNNFSSQAQAGALWWDTTVQALYTYTGGAWVRIYPVQDTGWVNITSFGGNARAGSTTPGYRKIGNEVFLRGSIESTATQGIFDGQSLTTLPSTVRPTGQRIFAAAGATGAGAIRLSVSSSGLIQAQAPRPGSSGYVMLDDVNFLTT